MNPSSPAYSTITLAELQERDGTLTGNHEAHSVRSYNSYEGSVASDSPATESSAPPLTTNVTTIEDGETEVNAEISRLEERLAALRKRQAGAIGHVPLSVKDQTYDHDGMLAKLTELENEEVNQSPKVNKSQKRPKLKRQKSEQRRDSVDPKKPSIASSSPKPKKQRKDGSSPQPRIPLGDYSSGAAEGFFSACMWDHEFNFENMRDD
jgi:hypothetical protein